MLQIEDLNDESQSTSSSSDPRSSENYTPTAVNTNESTEELCKDQVSVAFSIDVQTATYEIVAICGSGEALGNWNPDRAIILSRAKNEIVLSNDYNRWEGAVQLKCNKKYNYRFFIGRLLTNQDESCMCVLRWETNISARTVVTQDTTYLALDTAIFGHIGGEQIVDIGWLTRQSAVQLNLHCNALCLWNNLDMSNCYIKCTPVKRQEDKYEGGDICINQEHVTVCNMSDFEADVTPQGQFGVAYDNCRYVTFQVQTLNFSRQMFRMDIYNFDSVNEDTFASVGFCYISILDLHGSCSVQVVNSSGKLIGHLTVHYLVIKPLPEQLCDMSAARSSHCLGPGCVMIGHRGSGSTYNGTTPIVSGAENTIASFKTAAQNGAAYVEFDVQLSKDKVPVIFHDLYVCLNCKQRDRGDGELVKISISELMFDQLQSMQLHHANRKELHWSCDDDDTHPFPTLEKCLKVIDEGLGFNIEVKYSMQYQNGIYDKVPYFERNEYVDIILDVVLRNASNRQIFFSSFDPDICILLKLKQHKYPIFFLTSCAKSRSIPYMNPITKTIDSAISFCRYYGLMGINIESNVILEDPSVVSKVKSANLTLSCWGNDNNDPVAVRQLRKLGVDAITCDKLDVVNSVENTL